MSGERSAASGRTRIPLFPLHTVLFPGGRLKLRIFEPRYVDMIGRCMRENAGFGVAMITEGVEAGGPARTAGVGTLARIVDFEQLAGGLLGITAIGGARFIIEQVTQQPDGLNIADAVWLSDEEAVPLPAEHAMLRDLARQGFEQLSALYGTMQPEYDNASWVSMRLAEMLPLAPQDRQICLEHPDALERLRFLQALFRKTANPTG